MGRRQFAEVLLGEPGVLLRVVLDGVNLGLDRLEPLLQLGACLTRADSFHDHGIQRPTAAQDGNPVAIFFRDHLKQFDIERALPFLVKRRGHEQILRAVIALHRLDSEVYGVLRHLALDVRVYVDVW